jgi:hypothetical protein
MDEGTECLTASFCAEDGVDVVGVEVILTGTGCVRTAEETVGEGEWLWDGDSSRAGAPGTTRAVCVVASIEAEAGGVLGNECVSEE